MRNRVIEQDRKFCVRVRMVHFRGPKPAPKRADPAAHPLMWRTILSDVAHGHGVTIDAIIGDGREVKVVLARAEAAYRMKHEAHMSLGAIGRRLGGRHHTTAMHAIRAHAARLAQVQ